MAKQLPEVGPMEPRPRRVTLDSEQRCQAAFRDWYLTPGVSPPEHIWQMGEHAVLQFNAWRACWRYLERQVQKEFIER